MIKIEISPRQTGKTTKLIKEFLFSSKDAYFLTVNNGLKNHIVSECIKILDELSFFIVDDITRKYISDEIKQKIISIDSIKDFNYHFIEEDFEDVEIFCDDYYLWPQQMRENFYRTCISKGIKDITIYSSLNKKISLKALKTAKYIKSFMKECREYIEDIKINDFSVNCGIYEFLNDFISDENVSFLITERMEDFYDDSKKCLTDDRYELEILGKIFYDDLNKGKLGLSNF